MRIIFIRLCRVGQFQIFQKFGRIITIHRRIEMAGIILVYSAIGSGHSIRVYRGFSLGQSFCPDSPLAHIIVLDGIREFRCDGVSTIFHVIRLIGAIGVLLQSVGRGLQVHFLDKIIYLVSINHSCLSITDMSRTFHIVLDTLPVAIDFAIAVCVDDQFRLIQGHIGILQGNIVVIMGQRAFGGNDQIISALFHIIGRFPIFIIGIGGIGEIQLFQQFVPIIPIHRRIEMAGIILVRSAIGGGHVVRIHSGLGFGQGFRTSSPTLYGIVGDGIRKLRINGIAAIFHMVCLVSPVSIFDQSFRRSRQPHFLFQVGNFIPIHDCRLGIPDMGSAFYIVLDPLPVPIDLAVAVRVDDQFSLIQVYFLGITNHNIVVGQIAGSLSYHVIANSRSILGMGILILQCLGNIIGHCDQLIDGLAIFIGGIHRIFGVSIGKSGQIISGLGIFLDFRGLTIDSMDIFRVHRQIDFVQGNVGIVDLHIIIIIGQRAVGLDVQIISAIFHIIGMVGILIGIGRIRELQLFQQVVPIIPIDCRIEMTGIRVLDCTVVRGHFIRVHRSFGTFQGHRGILDCDFIVVQCIRIGNVQLVAVVVLPIACVLHMIGPVIRPVPIVVLIGIGLIRQPQIRNQLLGIISVQSFCRIVQPAGIGFIHRTIRGGLPIRIHDELSLGHINGPGGSQIVVVSDIDFISVGVFDLQTIKGNRVLIGSKVSRIPAFLIVRILTAGFDGSIIGDRIALGDIGLGILPSFDRAVRIPVGLFALTCDAGLPFQDFQGGIFTFEHIAILSGSAVQIDIQVIDGIFFHLWLCESRQYG
ncbi:MAG: hypothetical protein MR947_04025 [Mitsuokella jalaludinii]|nr:hypothetical protein [Mitsuokella jalaludinii]